MPRRKRAIVAKSSRFNHNERVHNAVARERQIIAEARTDRSIFKSYVLLDDKGVKKLQPAALHLSWDAHQQYCIENGKYCSILAPWGHGKTEWAVIGDNLFDLARNPQMRIKIISNNDSNASLRILSIQKTIAENKYFHNVFPEIVPDKESKWNANQLFIKRKGASKDPSMEAFGVLSAGTGSRADKIAFDDPIDFNNAIAEPRMRQKAKDAIRQMWLSRLDEQSGPLDYAQVLYIATVWHEEDATMSYVMKNSEFSTLFQAIAETDKPSTHMNYIACRRGDEKKWWAIPLWEAKFPKEALVKKRRALGERAYNRGFRNRPYSDDDIIFQSLNKCLDYSLTPLEALKTLGRNWRIVTGVDPAGSKREGFALFTLACEVNSHIRVPLDIRVGAWSGREPIDQCLDIQKTWKPDLFIVENNNVQERVQGWIKDAGGGELLTKPFYTGKQKADPLAGLPGMDIEFANGLWVIPLKQADHREQPECGCPWCRWMKEIKYFPNYGSSDILMASWFAREEVRGSRTMQQLIDDLEGIGKKIGGRKQRGPTMPTDMRPKVISIKQFKAGASEMANW